MSKYEDRIVQLLKKDKIKFEREKTLADFRGGRYRFDFFIPSRDVFVEVDGEQHFQRVGKFHHSYSDFLKTKEHDRIKNAWCLAHHIELYRIPFWEVNKLQSSSEIFQKKFLVTTKWWNDNLQVPKNY